ncbi:uncharacterized protein LOC131937733 [Physella acuta]|uniref:uncharacterized protein LOC131937733 n=1 Tax=Physella acuta TaxID=109671 RepID=UPI0027DE6A8D|nr:uncharacterized protein LOC131937733 [Physella acuta]XP_059151330.1 uncharacterized protein LOC131937733 [Physella acuta]XP_059151331.1 uncharacterized protein LOC131937733 [Physella acuta]XP_059151332.1 uncharacterized protein LOC131937733 [Physella acuta]
MGAKKKMSSAEKNDGTKEDAKIHAQENSLLLTASTSSPSLLNGCSDTTTHVGASIGEHISAHHYHAPPEVSAIAHVLNVPSATLEMPPDSVFLTSSTHHRQLHRSQERPFSAPPDSLEKISGTLLRLVGDHYLCSSCGRQLRTLGDQLTFETNLRHALSASELNAYHNEN